MSYLVWWLKKHWIEVWSVFCFGTASILIVLVAIKGQQFQLRQLNSKKTSEYIARWLLAMIVFVGSNAIAKVSSEYVSISFLEFDYLAAFISGSFFVYVMFIWKRS